MKIRNGFVSNSSSSSFMLALNKPLEDVTIKVEASLMDLDGKLVKNRKELNKYFLEEYGWDRNQTIKDLLDDDEWINKNYQQCIALLKEGKKIFLGNVSNDDYNYMSRYLYDVGIPKSKDYKIIYNNQE